MIHAWTAQRMRRRRWSCVHSAHIKLMLPRCLSIPVSTVLANISWICSSWSFWFWNRSSMTSLLWGFMLDSEKLDVEEELEMWSTGEMCTPRQQDLDWWEIIKIAAFIWRQSYVSISELSVIHQYFISITCACLRTLLEIHTPIYIFFSDFQWYFSVIFSDTSAKHASYVC